MGYGLTSMYVVFALVFFSSIFFASLAQPKQISEGAVKMSKFNVLCFVLSFLIPWSIICFTRIGVDYDNYEMIIGRLDWDNLQQGDSEYGFNLVAMFFKAISGDNVHGSIFFIKSLTVISIYVSIYLMRDQVSFVHSVMFYLLIVYLPSFYVISQCFAASLVTLTMVYYFKRGNTLVSTALLLTIGMIHNSVFLLVPFFLLYAYSKNFRFLFVLLIIVAFVAIAFKESFFRYAQTFEGFHYNNYMRSGRTGTGLMVYFICAVMMWLVYLMYKTDIDTKRKYCLVDYSTAICLFNILGLSFDVITRMEFNFIVVYIILIPGYLRFSKLSHMDSALYVFVILFMLFKGYYVVTGRISAESMMYYYIPFNPFE